MKTRIRKKEYNNGKIEYICESESLKVESISCIFLGLIFCLYLYLKGYLFTTTMHPDGQESVNPIAFIFFSVSLLVLFYGLYQYSERWCKISYLDSECVFSNLEDAKEYIDGEIFKYNQNKEKREGEKTKKTTIIKYP